MRDIDWWIFMENKVNIITDKSIEDIYFYKNLRVICSLNDIDISKLNDLIYGVSRRLI